jgi:hypothetical protein
LARWQYDPQTNHLEVTVKDGTEPRYFLMAQPARIVVDLPETSIGEVTKQASYEGAVRQIRLAQHNKNTTRIVLELAPNVVLAPGQVQLQRVNKSSSGNVRWVVRPLIAANSVTQTDTTAIAPTTPVKSAPLAQPASVESAQATTKPVSDTSSEVPSAAPAQPVSLAPVLNSGRSPLPAVEQDTAATKPTENGETSTTATSSIPSSSTTELPAVKDVKPSSQPATTVPPSMAAKPAATQADLEKLSQGSDQLLKPMQPITQPIAIAVPAPETSTTYKVEVQPSINTAKPVTPTVSSPPSSNGSPTALAIATPTPAQSPTSRSTTPFPDVPSTPTLVKEAPSLVEMPDTVPVLVQASSQPTVTVPPLDVTPTEVPSSDTSEFPTPGTPNISPAKQPDVSVPPLQPLEFPTTPSTPSVTVPPLQPQAPLAQPASRPATPTGEVIDFGQPLPAAAQTQSFFLSKGTILSLRYPNTVAMKLRSGTPQQEVLFLESEVRDGRGYVIFPAGSAVTGRFETSTVGSRFIAQAISIGGRNIPMVARSEAIAGGRQISENNLLRNAGIGAVAGAVLSDFSGFGVLGGAAAGAAVTYFTSPKPATIQPYQIIQVRLLEDLQRL